MTIATLGAICLGDFGEAAVVMVLYQIGEYLQEKALKKSKKSIGSLINIRPLYANVERNGRLEKVKPQEVKEGEIVLVKAGEKIPADGIIEEGHASVNTSALTGESILRDVKEGDYVLGGFINLNGLLKIRSDKPYTESTVYKFAELIENARKKKSQTERLITKFARVYTPVVLMLALCIIVVPFAMHAYASGFSSSFSLLEVYIERALTFLVISCPCAFVISVPLTFFCGIGLASKFGVLIKEKSCLEALANVNIAVFDKTGTLTNGQYKITKVILAPDIRRDEFEEIVLSAEANSNHPIAEAVKKSFGNRNLSSMKLKNSNFVEIAGKGISSKQGPNEILIGNYDLMKEYGISVLKNKNSYAGTMVYVAKNHKHIGCIVVSDEVRPSAKIAISQLRGMNIRAIMLTGDVKDNALATAKFLGIDEWAYGLLPENKVYRIEELINENNGSGKILYIGDGINDAPVIKRADIGIAMGVIGSEAAIDSADIVIADDNLSKIFIALNIAKKTVKIAKQNIAFTITIKILFLLMGSFGFMTMWAAIFADTGVTLFAIINSLKVLQIFNNK